jgi:inorganic pyrophosphatase/exopolyphosphatase
MTTSKVINENVITALFDDVLEEVCKAFKERKKAQAEKEMQELLAFYMKDRHGSVTQIMELVLPPIDSTKEVHIAKVSHPSTSVTPEDVSLCFLSMLN